MMEIRKVEGVCVVHCVLVNALEVFQSIGGGGLASALGGGVFSGLGDIIIALEILNVLMMYS